MQLVLKLDEELTRFVEPLPGFVEPPAPHEEHAEVERRDARPVGRTSLQSQLDSASERVDGSRIISNFRVADADRDLAAHVAVSVVHLAADLLRASIEHDRFFGTELEERPADAHERMRMQQSLADALR